MSEGDPNFESPNVENVPLSVVFAGLARESITVLDTTYNFPAFEAIAHAAVGATEDESRKMYGNLAKIVEAATNEFLIANTYAGHKLIAEAKVHVHQGRELLKSAQELAEEIEKNIV